MVDVYPVLWGLSRPSLPRQASHIAELQPNFLPSGQYIPVAEANNSSGAHIHDNKRIGDVFPGIGYGTSANVLVLPPKLGAILTFFFFCKTITIY